MQAFHACIEKLIVAMDKKLSMRLDGHSVEMFDLHKRMDSLQKQNDSLVAANGSLSGQITQLTNQLDRLSTSFDEMDQHSRNVNLLIHGVQPTSPTGQPEVGLSDHVVNLLNRHLGTTVTEMDIQLVHRLGRLSTTASTLPGATTPSSPRTPPIIVQFSSRRTRNLVLSRRRSLKGMGFSITEQLTVRRASLLKKCSDLVAAKKLDSAWSHDGKIFIKTLSNRTVSVSNDHDISAYN